MTKQSYAVIGLGRFGLSIASKLFEAGQEVMGIDIDEERIDDGKLTLTHAVVLDSTEEESLKSIGIRNFDYVIVAIGNDMQASILTALLLKDMGVKKVIAKALNKRHGQVLTKVGADWVIHPERDMGERVAHQLLSPNVLNYIELSSEYNIEEIMIPPGITSKNLRELDLRAKYNLTAIAVVNNENIIISPSPDQILQEGDKLVVLGNRENINQFANIK
ncbi:TrkA family potassium uptake protein [Neobacillus sp. 179-C4.2 HS]|jgi:trk system potassium uptake protein|uniref:TrkA family potassium uptake protein n=1 Tax=Neobacillus driksii TaxID=3035913 RepID=A0ABV4YRI3_9BACI|nr:TrkA family potassium uptake protein [Neobacillus sp. 179.-C4.2 HS]MDP5194917.1 TrkA family potassium uptake protein [Neobacillus sp. 179.-C4.2 HS]